MRVTFAWRREDSGYLAAGCAAAAVVVYLVIGNFGLLPSPFSGPRPQSVADTIEPVLVAQPAPVEVDIPRVDAPEPERPVTPPVAPSAPRDDAPPALTVTTEPGTSFTVAQAAVVEGLVRDADSGVDEVLVTFTSATGKTVVPADVTCDDASRRVCFWRAEVPAAVASGYTVTAKASDRAGNTALSKAIDVTVVNPGGAVGQVTDVVERVPTVLNKLVGSVVGILGGGN